MNQNLDEKQARFQLNNIPNRLGHIAANLARIKSFSQIAYKEAVKSVIVETKWVSPQYIGERVIQASMTNQKN